jgi:hypothetical protein
MSYRGKDLLEKYVPFDDRTEVVCQTRVSETDRSAGAASVT